MIRGGVMLKQIRKINVQSLLSNQWVLLGMAIVAAGLLTFVIYQFLHFKENALRDTLASQMRGQAVVSVVVPTRDLPPGVLISSANFASREIPADLARADNVQEADFDSIAGRALLKAVRRGTPIRHSDVAGLDARDFSELLAKGMRAITIEADMTNSTDRMLKPGDRVDLVLLASDRTATPGTRGNSDVAQLLLSDVAVLATGQDTRTPDRGEAFTARQSGDTRGDYGSITLSVTPTQAAKIALAQKIGTLRAILRNPDDKIPTPTVSVTAPSLFAREEAPGIEYITGGRQGEGLVSLVPADQLGGQMGKPSGAAAPAAPAPASAAGTGSLTPQQVQQLSAMARALSNGGKTN